MDFSNYPLLEARKDTPFVRQLVRAYSGDSQMTMSVNGKPMAVPMWNLILSYRDLSLWCGPAKMRPHRHWRVSDVKAYFGIKGTGQKLLERFEALKAEVEQFVGA